MGLALYRKYRPATFAEVVGQEHVTGPLMTAVDSGRINHAYLFSGPRGCGKTSSARILARSLNCEQGPTSTPCGTCQSCLDLAPDGPGNIDVIEIDAASHGGVDDARDLRERAFQLPVASRYKVYIIDEAHMVSNQGFNALLKVVEEPPESVIFIFATTEPDKVLPTIRSRTHHYPFRLVPPPVMRQLLERNCASEGVTVGAAVLPLVVRAGGGSVRDSQSLLDQLIAGAGPEGITYENALALLGATDAALLDDMIEAIGVADGATVFGTVQRLVDAGHDPRRFTADLLDRLRDLILLAAVPEASTSGVIDVPQDHLERLADQAGRLGLSTLSRLADLVHEGLTEMRGTTAPRLALELICARMLLPRASGDAAALTQRVERLERRLEIGGAPAAPSTAPRSAPPSAPGADGLTPRQRAQASLAAEGGQRQPRPQPPAARPAPDAAPAATQPAAAPTTSAPQRPGQSESSGAGRPEAAPRDDAPTQAPSAPQQPAASTQPAPAQAAPRPAPAQPASRPASPAPATPVDDGGWPEVAAPGSGRRTDVRPAAAPDQVTPSAAPAPAEEPAPPADATPPETPQTVPAQAAPAAAAPQQTGSSFDVAEVRRQWRAVVDEIRKHSRSGAALVETATPVAVRGQALVLTAPPGLVRRLADPGQHRPLRDALLSVLGVSWAIEVTEKDAEPAPEPADVEDSDDPYDEVVDAPGPPLDPGEAAMSLLRDQLGASPLDDQQS